MRGKRRRGKISNRKYLKKEMGQRIKKKDKRKAWKIGQLKGFYKEKTQGN